MNLLESVVNIIGGAFTGYLTNDLAVKMIFRRFGPFGGIILKTKDRFITSISQLIEREIINGKTLARRTNRLAFKQALSQVVADFLAQLQQELTELKPEEMPGYAGTQLAWEAIWERHRPKLIRLIDANLAEKRLAQLLPETERRQILGQLAPLVAEWIRLHRPELEAMVNEAIDEVSGQVEKYLKNSLFANPARELALVDQLLQLFSQARVEQFDQWLSQRTPAELMGQTDVSLGARLTRNPPQLGSLLSGLKLTKEVQAFVVNKVLVVLVRRLDIILKGRVAGLVATNLHSLQEAQLQAVVAEFMGKELKPINLFGAVLGALASVALVFTGTHTNLFWSSFIFGLIGYLTNFIALKMVFRPYKPIYLAGVRVPFTPGVVAKQQQRFARSMANFVGEQLLEGASVSTALARFKWNWQADIKAYLSTDAGAKLPKLISQIIVKRFDLASYVPALTDKLAGGLHAKLLQHKGALKQQVLQQLEHKGGWSFKMANTFLGLDVKLNHAIDLIIEQKLPRFWQLNGDKLAHAIVGAMQAPELKGPLAKTYQQLVVNQANSLSPVLKELMGEVTSTAWLDPATLEFVTSSTNQALVTAFASNSQRLQATIDIKEVTEKEVGAMHPQAIEALFYGFAGPYLHRVELYGWFGGLVGLALTGLIKLVSS